MKFDTFESITAFIDRFNGFNECVITNFAIDTFFTHISITINSIWDKDGSMRSDLDKLSLKILHFTGVNSFNIFNDLNEELVNDLSSLNWGFNEFALLKVCYIEILRFDEPMLCFEFIWENERAIQIVCNEFSVETAS